MPGNSKVPYDPPEKVDAVINLLILHHFLTQVREQENQNFLATQTRKKLSISEIEINTVGTDYLNPVGSSPDLLELPREKDDPFVVKKRSRSTRGQIVNREPITLQDSILRIVFRSGQCVAEEVQVLVRLIVIARF
jgi:hypothetical protein